MKDSIGPVREKIYDLCDMAREEIPARQHDWPSVLGKGVVKVVCRALAKRFTVLAPWRTAGTRPASGDVGIQSQTR